MLAENNDPVRGVAMRMSAAAGPLAASIIALTSIIALPGTARADTMMSACAAEIATNCGGISEGRGRISACLYANDDRLSGACKAEVVEVSTSSTFQRHLPTGARTMQGAGQEAGLRAACTADADAVCSGVTEAKGRMLACVYARSDSVSKPCWAAAKVILD